MKYVLLDYESTEGYQVYEFDTLEEAKAYARSFFMPDVKILVVVEEITGDQVRS